MATPPGLGMTLDGMDSFGEAALRFGPYASLRVLGRGGVGTVYEARHDVSNRRVALKTLNVLLADDWAMRQRFHREAQILTRLEHPHLVSVLEAGEQDGRPFIALELLEGETLAAFLARAGRLALPDVVDLFLPVLSAVAALHDAGIVHRDLKASNLMLARRGAVRIDPVVLDFGIAKFDGSDERDASITDSRTLLGTLAYLSPEQLMNGKSASFSSDQYALGVLLYECATGVHPFLGASQYELMHAIMNAPLPAPSSRVEGLPPEFDALVARALNRDTSARFPSLRALGAALLSFGSSEAWTRWAREFSGLAAERSFGGLEQTQAEPLGAPPRAPRPAAGSRTAVKSGRTLAAGAALGIAAVAGLLLLRARPTEAPISRSGVGAPPPTAPAPPISSASASSAPRVALAPEDPAPRGAAPPDTAISAKTPQPQAPARRKRPKAEPLEDDAVDPFQHE